LPDLLLDLQEIVATVGILTTLEKSCLYFAENGRFGDNWAKFQPAFPAN
jgi:hypothetical protein